MKTQPAVERSHHLVGAKKSNVTNQRTSKISKRSCIMKASKIFEMGLPALFAIALMVSIVSAQTYKNGGTLNNTGILNVKAFNNYSATKAGTLNNTNQVNVNVSGGSGNFNNDGGGALQGYVRNRYNTAASTVGTIVAAGTYANGSGTTSNDTTGGSSVLIKVAGALTSTANFSTTIGTIEYNGAASQAGLTGITYGGLKYTGTDTVSLAAGSATTVSTTFVIGANGGIQIGANTLNIAAASPSSTSGQLKSHVTGEVNYSLDNNQAVLSGAYGKLTLTGTGTYAKTVSGGGAVSVANVLTNPSTVTLDLGSSNFTAAASADLSNTTNAGTIKTTGSVTFNQAAPDIGGTFEYANTGSPAVAIAQYRTLKLSGSTSTPSFAADEFKIAKDFVLAGATLPVPTFAATTTIHYNGTAAAVTSQAIAALDYKLLKFSNDATKTLSGVATAVAGAPATTAVDISTTDAALTIATGASLTASTGTVSINGSLTVDGTGALTAGNSGTANSGFVTVTSNGSVNIAASTGAITVYGDFTNDGALTNAGTITVN